MKKLVLFGFCLGIFMSLASISQANLITNGSFENGINITMGRFDTLSQGDSTSILGWTVTGGTIDYIGTYWQAADGYRSLDMCGNGSGSISQTFTTTPGQLYKVDFSMAGNPDGTPNIKQLVAAVTSGGVGAAYFTFDTTGKTKADMGWETKTFDFTALGASSTLTFFSVDYGSPCGAALDNVSVNAVPVPAAFYLFASGLFGLISVQRKK